MASDEYAKFGAPYLERIVRSLDRSVPSIVFGVETGELLGQLASSGAEVVGVDWRVPLSEARRRTGPRVALQGNLDPAALLLPREALERRVRRVLDEARAAGGGHLFNLGHGILPSTPVENARCVVQLVHEETARP